MAQKTENKIEVGTRVFNRGDMANAEEWGTITKIEGYHIFIKGDDDNREYAVPASMVCLTDKGNGLTRIVTEYAYKALRAEKMAALKKWVSRAAA